MLKVKIILSMNNITSYKILCTKMFNNQVHYVQYVHFLSNRITNFGTLRSSTLGSLALLTGSAVCFAL
jgi:hypothetical protein